MSVFLDAIEVLEEQGWRQHPTTGTESTVCIWSALATAMYRGGSLGLSVHDTPQGVTLRALEPYPSRFNDDPSTSYEDVILLLKRAHEAWQDDQSEAEVG